MQRLAAIASASIEVAAAAAGNVLQCRAHSLDPPRHRLELGELLRRQLRPPRARRGVAREAVEQHADLIEAEAELFAKPISAIRSTDCAGRCACRRTARPARSGRALRSSGPPTRARRRVGDAAPLSSAAKKESPF